MLQASVPYITFIITITGKTALFEPQPSLEDSARFDPGFRYLGFATVKFLQSKVISLASKPRPGGSGLCMSRSDRVAQLYPQALGSLFVASYDSQGYGGDILRRPIHI
jgi:hypothetical protein